MNEKQKTAVLTGNGRSHWQRPTVRRIEAGAAEGVAGAGADNVVFS
jgi:hypothetical protein